MRQRKLAQVGNVHEGHWHGVAVDIAAWREEDERRQKHGRARHKQCVVM